MLKPRDKILVYQWRTLSQRIEAVFDFLRQCRRAWFLSVAVLFLPVCVVLTSSAFFHLVRVRRQETPYEWFDDFFGWGNGPSALVYGGVALVGVWAVFIHVYSLLAAYEHNDFCLDGISVRKLWPYIKANLLPTLVPTAVTVVAILLVVNAFNAFVVFLMLVIAIPLSLFAPVYMIERCGFMRAMAKAINLGFSSWMSLAFSIVMIVLIGGLMLLSIDITEIVTFIINGTASNILFVKILDVVFPQTGLIAEFMAGGSFYPILVFAALCLLSLVILSVCARLFYMESVTRLNETTHVQKNASSSLAVVYRSRGMSLFIKEMRILVRTPAFMTNCVAANFVWPVFVLIFAKIMRADPARASVTAYFETPVHKITALAVILSITMVTAAMNCLGSDAFSREGKAFDYIKSIPVSYKLQWNVKTAAAMVWTLAGTVPFFAFFVIYAGFDILTAILAVLMVIASSFFVTELGMLLDSLNPKLFWLDALSALRENYNTVFCMGITIVLCGLLAGGLFLPFPELIIAGTEALVLCVSDVVLYLISMRSGVRNLMQIGE